MHPTCKQVPPRKGSFSTTIVFSPSSPARIAATYPPGPLPIIATSYFATRSLPSAGARTRDRTWWSDCRHTSVALEETRGGQAKRRGASRSFYECHSKRSFYERHSKRTKSRPRLRRRRLRPSKQEILTAVRPLATSLRPVLLSPAGPRNTS